MEHAQQLSLLFPHGKVNFIWLPSALNLADCLTRVSRDPVKLVNSALYRSGQLKADLSYLELHDELKKNTFYQVVRGKAEYHVLDYSSLVTCGWDNKLRSPDQAKKR